MKRLCVDHEPLPQLSSTHAHFITHRCCRCHPCNSNPMNCTGLLPMAMRNVLDPPAREERTSNYRLGRASSRYPGLAALLVLRCELEWHSWPPYCRLSLPRQSSTVYESMLPIESRWWLRPQARCVSEGVAQSTMVLGIASARGEWRAVPPVSAGAMEKMPRGSIERVVVVLTCDPTR